MSKRIYVVPGKTNDKKPKTLIVRQPDKGYEPIPETGAYVPKEGPHWPYYYKRLKEKSLTEAKPPKPAKAETKTATKE